ncbi:MAG: aspartate aminotransferase family protein [Candidatus Omnitrophota bacterium]|nr:MAG: aspartate aminotransferase family protein [Candidatus Omnitrophota bacterium]
MQKTRKVIETYNKYVLNTYTRAPVVFTKAKGSWIWDIEGKRYLDFFPGWAVSGLGHCHPMVIKALKSQSDKILHVSNNYYSQPQAALAERISKLSFNGKVFFANSGAEANEAAIKLARAYGKGKRYEIITMKKSFHGRTLATAAATGQDKVKKGFEPLPAGFKHVQFNDIDSFKKAISKKTVAVMLELIQGEGGINIASQEYVKALRKLCNIKKILLIIDEVQTGIARTGRMFCYQHYGIIPDVMTLAKSLGGGVPIGAMVVRDKFADFLKPGMHASTFGGNPIVCAAALGVFDAIKKENLISNVNRMAKYFNKRLKVLKGKYPVIKNIKQKGLMIGIELTKKGDAIVKKCFENGLLINCTQGSILRIMPALTVTNSQIDKAANILDKAIGKK